MYTGYVCPTLLLKPTTQRSKNFTATNDARQNEEGKIDTTWNRFMTKAKTVTQCPACSTLRPFHVLHALSVQCLLPPNSRCRSSSIVGHAVITVEPRAPQT